ncbi:MAG: MCE family protein, partial [Acidimicrobiales bacterium]
MTAIARVGGPTKRRFGLETFQESRSWRAAFGLALTAAIVAAVIVIVMAFTGKLTNVVLLNAQLPASGNALPIGSLVEYRNVTVGKVQSEGAGPNGSVAVTLAFYPAKMAEVPRGVQALVAPLSIFGNQYVELVAPAHPLPGRLGAGQVIAADTSIPSSSLQGTVTQLYNLLNAVHPANLDTALTATAQALRGEGKNLGHTLDAASSYLSTLNPLLPTLQSDLQLAVPVLNQVNASSPQLLDLLAHTTTTSQTVIEQATALHDLLTMGAAASAQTAALLTNVQSTLPTLINDSGPILADISANPNELSQTLTGLGQWAAAWAAAESHGPVLTLTANLPIANINAAVEASLGY